MKENNLTKEGHRKFENIAEIAGTAVFVTFGVAVLGVISVNNWYQEIKKKYYDMRGKQYRGYGDVNDPLIFYKRR